MFQKEDKYYNKICILILIIFSKILIIMLGGYFYDFLPSGGDANYYHDSALGYSSVFTTTWPRFLNYLNEIGLYSRSVITGLIQFTSILIVPLVFFKLIKITTGSIKCALESSIVISLYLSLFAFSHDIYRDVLMVVLFLLFLVFFKRFIEENRWLVKICLFMVSIALLFLLFGLRKYLGLAILIAMLTYSFKPVANTKIVVFIYFVLMALFHNLGLFSLFYEYRNAFSELTNSGSNLGIDLGSSGFFDFIPKFVLSYIYQFFGFFLVNTSAIVFFLAESVALIYGISRVSKSIINDKFCRFGLYFILIYNTVWVLANDNLGTAVRLRMYSFIVVIILYYFSKENIRDKDEKDNARNHSA